MWFATRPCGRGGGRETSDCSEIQAGLAVPVGRRRVIARALAVVGAAAGLSACKHLAGGRLGCVELYGYGCDGGGDRDDPGGGSPGGGADGAGGGGGAGGGAGGSGPAGGGSATCILEGSLVVDGCGRKMPIEGIEIGDVVGCLRERAGVVVTTVVSDVLKQHLRDHYFVINGELRITNDHPVLAMIAVGHEWVRTEDLVVGNTIKTADGVVDVTSVERVDEAGMTVYLATEARNFLVAGGNRVYVVHGDYRDSTATLTPASRRAQLETPLGNV